MSSASEPDSGQRGPAEHAIREQILAAAGEHFRRYGYGKTTVSDLAEAIGISKAYIYKFFDSKQAIGEIICSQCLTKMGGTVVARTEEAKTATEKLRRMLGSLVELSANLFFSERKLYDITAHSCLEKWRAVDNHWEQMYRILEGIIIEGRNAGEFERKTALDETCRSILQAMQPFTHPLLLQHNLDLIPDRPNEVIRLILRSLAP